MDKKSLFRQGVYGNHGLCVKPNSAVPPEAGLWLKLVGQKWKGVGLVGIRYRGCGPGLFYPGYVKIDKNGVELSLGPISSFKNQPV